MSTSANGPLSLGYNPHEVFQWHRIAEVNPDGTETISPMKGWLREHPDHNPDGLSEKNSSTIARRLVQAGWNSKETPALPGAPGEVRLYPPGSPLPAAWVETEEPVTEAEYGSFRLEAEVRDFLANNLNLAKVGHGPLHLRGVEP